VPAKFSLARLIKNVPVFYDAQAKQICIPISDFIVLNEANPSVDV